MRIIFIVSCIVVVFCGSSAYSQDWPIFKGNLYFTGNNDEIIVKNSNLKWLFQADDRTFNPVVSDGRVFFLDQKADLYCLDEEYGRLIWKLDFQKISAQFKAFSKAAGKVKYPLIKGNTLFLSDPIAIYALDKRNGNVLWARTGMREEKLPAAASGLSGRSPLPVVDGIYSDPVLTDDAIFYGTRNMFLSRELRNGHEAWQNRDIQTYSAYPTYYDDSIITQSMDYKKNEYSVLRLDARTGKEIWKKTIEKPERIFPPVVYNNKVFIPVTKALYCLDYKTGENVWKKDYGRYISSNPSFTDKAVLFSLDNSDMAIVNPENGNIIKSITLGQGASPAFVTIRDTIYFAFNEKRNVSGKEILYGKIRAVNFTDNSEMWSFQAPFPGSVSQPIAKGGILFFPSGNYVYALGTEYYAKVVQGGDGYAASDSIKGLQSDDQKKKLEDRLAQLDPNASTSQKNATPAPEIKNNNQRDVPQQSPTADDKKIPMKDVTISVGDESGSSITAAVEIRKWEKGRLVYSDVQTIKGKASVKVPAGDGVEVTASSQGYIPKKEILTGSEKDKDIRLDKMEKGKSFVVENINFEFDKAYLKKESINLLDRVVKIMKDNKGLKIEVRGYTDNIGESAYNQKLSEKRADSVAEYMIKQGISPERVRAKGFGETKPLVPNNSEKNRAKNRRTEFVFE